MSTESIVRLLLMSVFTQTFLEVLASRVGPRADREPRRAVVRVVKDASVRSERFVLRRLADFVLKEFSPLRFVHLSPSRRE